MQLLPKSHKQSLFYFSQIRNIPKWKLAKRPQRKHLFVRFVHCMKNFVNGFQRFLIYDHYSIVSPFHSNSQKRTSSDTLRFSFLIFVVVRLCLTDCRRNSLPCNCVFRALCPWTSGCAAIPCACIAHLPLIYLSTMQKPSRWTTGGQTIRWFPAAITHNITMYFPLTVW